MKSLKELGKLMKIGYRLFYGDCISLKHTLDRIVEYVPRTHSIFIWWPNQISCIRYARKGVPDNTLKSRFNANANEKVELVQLLHNVRMTADSQMLESRGIPENSVIILSHPSQAIGNPDVQTLMGYVTSCPNYANAGIHFFVYEDKPIVQPFLQQHGIELKVNPLDKREREEFLIKRLDDSGLKNEKKLFLNNKEVFDEIVNSSHGLPPEEIDSIIDWGFIEHRFDDDPSVFRNRVAEIQAKKIENSDVLSFMPDDEALDEEAIGGFNGFLEDLKETKAGLSEEAKATGIGIPKGVVLVGFPGTGKTMASRIIGKILGLKTIRFDVATIFGAFLGESEIRMKHALRLVEEYGPCMVYIDDADKVLNGASGGSATEGSSSTIKRVLGMLFTWLNDNTSGAYVVMTMNNKDGLPIELLRSGRFDKIYFVGLPTRKSRRYIFERSFEKLGLRLSEDEWDRLLDATRLYTGAEVVQIIKEAMWYSLYRRGSTEPTIDDLIMKAGKGNHIVQSNPESIIKIRKSWGPYLTRVDDEENLEEVAFFQEWERTH